MRIGELTIYQEGEPQVFDLELAEKAIRCLPGRLAVAPDKPREKYGSILLPDTTGQRERPDCGTVVSVGHGERHGLEQNIPLWPGDRVLLRPCKGKWIEDFQSQSGDFELPEVRFYGVTSHWRHEVLAVWRGEAWQPLNDWVIVKRESNEESNGILIANSGNKRKKNRAVVLNCQPGIIKPGDTVFLESNPNYGLGFAYGDLEGCEIVEQIDEDGIRRIWAILEECVA